MSHAPKITLSDEPEEDFNFYVQLVAPLVPKLLEEKDRMLAAEWLLKLVEDKTNPKLRIEYLLLLFFSMQSRQLIDPFLNSPSETEPVPPFEDNLDLFQMMERLATKKARSSTVQPYYSEMSGDFKEYIVAQELSSFGVHCYFAISSEPIQKWRNAHLAQIPKETTAAAYQSASSSRGAGSVPPRSPKRSPPTPPTPREEAIAPAREEARGEVPRIDEQGTEERREGQRVEHSINLQDIQDLLNREDFISKESLPIFPPSFTDFLGPSSVQESQRRDTDYSAEFRAQLRAAESLTNSEMDRLMAEYEEKLKSLESNTPAFSAIPQITTTSPRRSPTPSQAGASSYRAIGPRRSRSSIGPIQKAKS